MNTTPRQQVGDDGGVAPASGARPSLEHTVLGVAPAPALPVGAAIPSAAPVEPAMPPPLDLPEPPAVSVPPAAPPAVPPAVPRAALIAAPVIVVAAPEERQEPREVSATEPPPVTAPIPLVQVAAPPRPGPPRPAPLDRTLPVGGTPPPAASAPPSASAPEAVADPNAQRTALSEDYLRDARQAALDALAGRAPPPSALGDTVPSIPHVEPAPASFGTRPSIVATPLPRESEPRSTPEGVVSTRSSRGFEPVPVLRAPLAESLSGGLGPVAELGGRRSSPPSSARSRPLPARRGGDGTLRWLLLAAVALVSVASVMVGQRLWQRYRDGGPEATAAASAGEHDETPARATSTARALMPSPPPAEAAPPGQARVVAVTGGALGEGASPGSVGPEAQLAATAGRHVMAGNYAEALPLYQQLERAYPENSVYVAMTRVLQQKVGAATDTRTITPAPSPRGKP